MGKGARMVMRSRGSSSGSDGVTKLLEAPDAVKQPQSSSSTPEDDVDLSKVVDMRGPLVWQILSKAASGELTADVYERWVHTPYNYKEEPKHMRMFASEFLETFSKTAWWVVPLVWVPVCSAIIMHYGQDDSPAVIAAHVVAGLLSWTAMEYILHRFLFHAKPMQHPILMTMHFVLHGCHHKVPQDRLRLVFPPVALVTIAAIVIPLIRLVTLAVVPSFARFSCAAAGLVLGYVVYDVAHYFMHHGNLRRDSFMGRRRKIHLRHHFAQKYKEGFGITSDIWDKVFSTELKVD